MSTGRVFGMMTTCSHCDDHTKQKTCELYVKSPCNSHCTFLKFEEYCDWHEDYANIANKVYKPSVPPKSETSWPTKDELAERQQAVIDSTSFGV